MKSVGIDIGNFSIKVGEVDAGGKNSGAITGYNEHPINPDPRADRQLEIVEVLRAIAAQYDTKTAKFVVGIPQHYVAARLKRFPFKERPKILKSLSFELEDDIPLDVDETVFEAKICEILGDSAQVIALACPNENVAEVLERFKDGGIDPDIVSCEGLALANCFERWQLPPPQLPAQPTFGDDGAKPVLPPADARLVLNIGHSRTQLLAYREGTLVAVRSILWGGVEVADALAKTFSVPFSEAVRILQKKSFILMNSVGASRDQIVLSNAVSKEVDTLVREVRLTMLELKTEFNLNFVAIDMLGGVSQIQNLGPYLTQTLEVPANIYHHFPNHRVQRIEQTAGIEAVSAIAIGLALEGVKKPRNPAVNFRRGEFARQNKSMQLFWETWRPVLHVAVIAFLLFNVYSIIRDTFADSLLVASEDKVAEQAAAINLPKNQRTIGGVKSYIRDTQKQISARRTLSKLDKYNSTMDVVRQLASNMPIGSERGGVKMAMDIKRLQIDNDTVLIEGRVSNQAQVEAVRTAIQSMALPNSVQKANATGARPGGVPFAFQFKVNRLQ